MEEGLTFEDAMLAANERQWMEEGVTFEDAVLAANESGEKLVASEYSSPDRLP